MNEISVTHPIELAVNRAGGPKKLAEDLGVHVTYIYKMVRTKHVPTEQCKAIEELTGITRAELRPDVFA